MLGSLIHCVLAHINLGDYISEGSVSHTVGQLRIASFSGVRKLLIRKLILLIAHPYVQFAQTQLLNLQCS